MLNDFLIKAPYASNNITKPRTSRIQTYNQIFDRKSHSKQKCNPHHLQHQYNSHIDSHYSYQDQEHLSDPHDYQNDQTSTISYNYPIKGGKKYQIEDHLKRQNSNLKEQIYFLVQQVRKALKKIEQYKEKLKQYKHTVQQLQNQNHALRLQYLQTNQKKDIFIQKLKQYPDFFTKIQQPQDTCSYKDYQNMHNDFINSRNQETRKVKVLSTRNTKSIEKGQKKCNTLYQPAHIQILKIPQLQNNKSTNQTQENTKLEQLNLQFEVLIQQFKFTKDANIRKKCIQIAKQMQSYKANNSLCYQQNSQRLNSHERKPHKFNSQKGIKQKKKLLDSQKNKTRECVQLNFQDNQNICKYLPQHRSGNRSYAN